MSCTPFPRRGRAGLLPGVAGCGVGHWARGFCPLCLSKQTLLATTCLVPAEWALVKRTLSLFIGLPSSLPSLLPMVTLLCVTPMNTIVWNKLKGDPQDPSSFNKHVCGLCLVLETQDESDPVPPSQTAQWRKGAPTCLHAHPPNPAITVWLDAHAGAFPITVITHGGPQSSCD